MEKLMENIQTRDQMKQRHELSHFKIPPETQDKIKKDVDRKTKDKMWCDIYDTWPFYISGAKSFFSKYGKSSFQARRKHQFCELEGRARAE